MGAPSNSVRMCNYINTPGEQRWYNKIVQEKNKIIMPHQVRNVRFCKTSFSDDFSMHVFPR